MSNDKKDHRRVNKEERRNTILDAAEKIFSQKDYHDATLEEIAQTVSISKAALYLYFENKIDLFLSMVERKLSQLVEALETAMSGCDNEINAIKRAIEVELEFFNENMEFFLVFQRQRGEIQLHAKLSDDEIKDRVLPFINSKVGIISKYIKQGQKNGTFQTVNPTEAAFMLTALIHTCVFMRVMSQQDNNLLGKADIIGKIFLNGLLVRE